MPTATGLSYCKTIGPQSPELRGSSPDLRSEIKPEGVAAMPESSIMSDLMSVIVDRKTNPQDGISYVTNLLAGGVPRIGGKIIEEAAEVVEAGGEPGDQGREHLVKEVADLVFHSMVLLGYRDLHWDDVEAELRRRSGTSGIAEKAARGRRGD
jgi:phosphoribosyl-ATP pyrophosphohydrolase